MLELNGFAAAMGEDVIYPGASILRAGSSFRDLNSSNTRQGSSHEADEGGDDSEIDDNADKAAGGTGSVEEGGDRVSSSCRHCAFHSHA
jgi:hypothetical protein